MNKKIFVIWVTRKCNLRCEYCYEKKNQNNLSMDVKTALETAEYIINDIEVNKLKQCDIHFHGGEPLLNTKCIELLINIISKRCTKCSIKYSLTTNGTIFSDRIYNSILKKIDTLSISIDGSKTSHNEQRKFLDGTGTFEKVYYNYLKIRKKRSDLRIRMTITSKNVNVLLDNFIFLVNQGIYYIDPAIDFFDQGWNKDNFKYLEENLTNIKEYIARQNLNISFDLIESDLYQMIGCGGGSQNINIDIDGNIYICTFVVGNKSFEIGDIISGIKTKKIEGIFKKFSKDFKECCGCLMKPYCIATNCRILQYALTLDAETPAPILCCLQQMKYKFWKKEHCNQKGDLNEITSRKG